MDYVSTPINATFAAGSVGAMVNISVTNDSIAEESETFNLAFTIPSSLSGKVIPGNITTATGIITDETGKTAIWLFYVLIICTPYTISY